MTDHRIDRRSALQLMGAAGVVAVTNPQTLATPSPSRGDLVFCLNTATIRQQKIGMVKELQVSAKAGFGAVELWVDTLVEYLDHGGSTRELKKIIDDLGIDIADAIGFEPWIVDDTTVRAKALENLKKQMDLLAEIGCRRIAAPPAGAVDGTPLDLKVIADRYRGIVELGASRGVIPQLELWGFSANLNTLSDVMFAAIECGDKRAKILLDNYHLYKGGSKIESLHLIGASATDILHVNDYPKIDRAAITDADRLMPGDGVSPLKAVIAALNAPGRKLLLSVEIFNKKYYQQDALTVARTAFDKIKKVVSSN